MNIQKLKLNQEKLIGMNLTQLQHVLQLADIYLENYIKTVKNYPSRRYENCAKPHIHDWNVFINQIQEEIELR